MKNKLLSAICIIMVILVVCTVFLTGCTENGEGENIDSTPKEYTIQYTDDSGTHTINVTYGMPYSIESIPEKKGYDFIGLYDAEAGGTQYISASGSSLAPFSDKKNMVLFPQYRAKEYTLVLDYQGAEVTGTRSLKVGYGSLISDLPLNLTIENKNFSGWYTQPNKKGVKVADQYGPIPSKNVVNEKNFDLSDPDGYIYLYAGFKGEEFLVTFYPIENGAPEEVLVEYGTPISDVQLETRVDGKAVIEWSKKSNDINKDSIFNGKVTSEMILYAAEYAPVIDFNANGGENVNSLIARAGSYIRLPKPQRDNYQFVGWQTREGNIFSGTTMPEESLQLTAKWQAMIIFDTNGGTDVVNISEPQGTKITLPATEKDGFIFAGWYSENGDKYTNTAMPSTSLRLIAKYWKIEKLTKIIISESETRGGYGSTVTIVPSMDKCYHEIDFSELYDKGVRSIKVTAFYQSMCDWAKASDPQYNYMAWYSTKTASDAYKLWSYGDEHTSGKYESYTRTQVIPLENPNIYICRYVSTVSSFWVGINIENYEFYWKNFYIEVEYPDMSKLY